MNQKAKHIVIIAFVIVLLDQVTKALIVAFVPQGTSLTILPGFFDIVHGRNTGAAFGMLHTWNSGVKNLFFYIMALVALAFLVHYAKSLPKDDRWSLTALGLIVGGALGNIADRIFRGSVVDFLSFHFQNKVWTGHAWGYHWSVPLYWPSFNVADSAISVAVVILIVRSFWKPKNR